MCRVTLIVFMMLLTRPLPIEAQSDEGSAESRIIMTQGGQDFFQGSLNDAFSAASKVSRVRILERRPVQDWNFSNRNCGYIYRVEVKEAFKGGDKPFEFFSNREQDFLGNDRDYLVFIQSRFVDLTGLILDYFLRDILPDHEWRSARCQTTTKYFAQSRYFALHAFDPEASRLYGGEWVKTSQSEKILMCRYNPNQPISMKRDENIFREKVPGDPSSAVQSWNDVRGLLLKVKINPSKLPFC